MGLGWDRALEVFDYSGETLEQAMARTRLQPRVIAKQDGAQVSQLIGYERTPHFASRGLSVAPGGKVALRNERFYAAAVVRGGGDVTWAGGKVELRAGDAFFVSNAVADHEYAAGTGGLEIITAEPPVLE